MKKADFVTGEVYIVNKQRRDNSKNHWHYNIFYIVEKLSKSQFEVISINPSSGIIRKGSTKDWGSFVAASEFIKANKSTLFTLIFEGWA